MANYLCSRFNFSWPICYTTSYRLHCMLHNTTNGGEEPMIITNVQLFKVKDYKRLTDLLRKLISRAIKLMQMIDSDSPPQKALSVTELAELYKRFGSYVDYINNTYWIPENTARPKKLSLWVIVFLYKFLLDYLYFKHIQCNYYAYVEMTKSSNMLPLYYYDRLSSYVANAAAYINRLMDMLPALIAIAIENWLESARRIIARVIYAYTLAYNIAS